MDRFGNHHALGLRAFAEFRTLGVEPSTASALIEESWNDILVIVGQRGGPLCSELCGHRKNDLGFFDSWAAPHRGSKGRPMAQITIDLRMLWEWMQADIAKLACPISVADDDAEAA